MQSKILGWIKKFGPAQNILGPVKGQGISLSSDYSMAKLPSHSALELTVVFGINIYLH
jgi:hypothetical protein